MILVDRDIKGHVKLGNIFIDDFSEDRLNPNSYNLRLHNKLLVYKDVILDMKKKNETKEIIIPEEGFLLLPGTLYLGRTKERTITRYLVPMLEGRSSGGRLGLFIHVTAGFGDVGFDGYWTLELTVVQPLVIYPDIEVCQIFYHTPSGEAEQKYVGKYQNNNDIQGSMMYKDFK